MNAPLVSIIIPAHNSARYIAEAVHSALDQEYAAKELIIVNDGSTDNTIDVLNSFGNAIKVIDQKNGGPAVARNAGLHAARGHYIAFLDADDVWLPGKLAAQVAHLEAYSDVGAVYTAWHVWNPDDDGIYCRPQGLHGATAASALDEERSGWIYNRLLFECELLTTTVMLRALVAEKVGDFDPTLLVGEDYDYWLRMARLVKIDKLRGIGALYRASETSATRRPRLRNYEHDVVSRAVTRWGLVGPDGRTTDTRAIARRLEKLTFRHGYSHYHAGDPRVALIAFREVLRHDVSNTKAWIYAILSALKLASRVIQSRSESAAS